jgi:hypothetical protein
VPSFVFICLSLPELSLVIWCSLQTIARAIRCGLYTNIV